MEWFVSSFYVCGYMIGGHINEYNFNQHIALDLFTFCSYNVYTYGK